MPPGIQSVPASERDSMGDLYPRASIGSSDVIKLGKRLVKAGVQAGRTHFGVSLSQWSRVGSENRDICGPLWRRVACPGGGFKGDLKEVV